MAVVFLTITPLGTGSPSVSRYVAGVEKILRATSLTHQLTAMGTIIEGEPWALTLPPIPIENGEIRGAIVDAQGRLIAHPEISLVLRYTDFSQLAQVKSARARRPAPDSEAAQRSTSKKCVAASITMRTLNVSWRNVRRRGDSWK